MEQYVQTIFQEPSYKGRQIFSWIHQKGINDIDAMSNLSLSFRKRLKEQTHITSPVIARVQKSSDGTIKWLMQLKDQHQIETVFIPEPKRGTLCISSQVGCALKCDFCATGAQGFIRNLTTDEIIGQLWLAVRLLSEKNGAHDHVITNVVMMGMGEPLLNLSQVVPAIHIMRDDRGYGLSKHRVTVSTSGLVPEMKMLQAQTDVALAVSLHATSDKLRNQLVPINKKYPIQTLLETCRHYYPPKSGRKITFEYVMLNECNDRDQDALMLSKQLSNIPSMVNLIPFNPFKNTRYTCSSRNRIKRFQSILRDKGILTFIRKTRGADIDGACGQLSGHQKKKITIPVEIEDLV